MSASFLRRAGALLEQDIGAAWRRIDARRRDSVLQAFEHFLTQHPLSSYRLEETNYFELTFIRFLAGFVEQQLTAMALMQQGQDQFARRFARAVSKAERRLLMLDYARDLGASNRTLARDRRAFARWFGVDALNDRYRRRLAEREQLAAYALSRSGALAEALLQQTPADRQAVLWRQLSLDGLFEHFLEFRGDYRVRLNAFQALGRALRVLPEDVREDAVSSGALQFIYRAALDAEQPVWVQREAIQLIGALSLPALARTLTRRFSEPEPTQTQPLSAADDDAFVRAGAVSTWVAALPRMPELGSLADRIATDPAALVRQRLAEHLPLMPSGLILQLLRLLIADPASPAVRAAAVLALPAIGSAHGQLVSELAALLRDRLQKEDDEFACRVTLHCVLQMVATVESGTDLRPWLDETLNTLQERHETDPSLRIRRWCAQTRELLLVQTVPEWQALYQKLTDAAARLNTSKSARILSAPDAEPALLGRVLSALAQRDHGLELEPLSGGRYRLSRSPRFGFRLWRWLFELRHPSTEKRQGFRHTIGRHYRSRLRAPSSILAEVSQTKVPGEPLTLSSEDGWRPYLPLPDELLAALDDDAPVRTHRIFTSEGLTEIRAPQSLAARLRAWWQLTTRFTQYAEQRNWREGDPQPPGTYVAALRDLGFEVRFEPHTDPSRRARLRDPAVDRFFPVLIPWPWLGDLLDDFRHHLTSAYENTVYELAAFVALISGYFFGRHIYLGHRMRKARSRIPLVIGGWGTRGKSGTERLKAAMFNALGYGVFSKTTGCEAMFVMSRPYRALKELFLFRPYDKATIWEQFNMVNLASRLGTDVFLWECMGLTPSYIRVLQQHWMRDDLATITNTFPDHEDLQGPAGINIPDVMCEFIPPESTLITSEETMLPILQDGARARDTRLRAVGWLEAGLLTQDVLNRFPYEEHPYNIALVLALADELGIERDFALKEMADRVVLDLGVLKTYPTAQIRRRRLQFIMGMSANERYGAINNWNRMGLAKVTVSENPDVWVSTVVNNRADRVPRSRVFASILVNDIAADQHVLIGTNLKGMRGYIEESWREAVSHVSLFSNGTSREAVRQAIHDQTRALRVPTSKDELVKRIAVIVDVEPEAVPAEVDNIEELCRWVESEGSAEAVPFCRQLAEQHHAFRTFSADVDAELGGNAALSEPQRAALDETFHALLGGWFQTKLVYVDDPHIDGDALISLIADRTPPGMLNRIMGMQNIKGTGLGFVYCWQAWDQCYQAGQKLQSDDPVEFEAGLDELSGMQDFGVLSAEYLKHLLEEIKHRPIAQREATQARLSSIAQTAVTAADRAEGSRGESNNGLLGRLTDHLERFLDAGDAVRRRRLADRVYRDLIDERISEERAVVEIKRVNSRQKGGWLRARLGL